jgi:lipoate-protein ligase A
MKKVIFINSPYHEASFNIALEEYLVNEFYDEEHDYYILYLWQNDNSIIIGRNQNAYNECALDKLSEYNTKIVRRNTGGGAVFHDLGNLNFSIITPKKEYDVERSIKVIMRALSKFGLDVEYSGRNDILINGFKFSGNAFYTNNIVGLHHGTLLINTNFDLLGDLLTVSEKKLKPKGISSVKSRVINLVEVCNSITVDDLSNKLQIEFIKEYNTEEVIYYSNEQIREIENKHELKKRIDKYSSDAWNLGENFNFNINISEKFSWGYCEIRILLVDDFIRRISIYTDSLVPDLIEYIEKKLINSHISIIHNREKLSNLLFNDILDENHILRDIVELLFSKMNKGDR